MRLAAEMKLGEAERSALFYAMLLKDAGCSSSAARMAALFGADDLELKRLGKAVDWSRPSEAIRFTAAHAGRGEPPLARARQVLRALNGLAKDGDQLVETRCERGARIVTMLEFPSAASAAVFALDEHWDGHGKPMGLAGDQIPLLARIACLAQTAEVFLARDGVEPARTMVRRRSGRWFDPALAAIFVAIEDGDPLWQQVASIDSSGVEGDDLLLEADDERLDRLAQAFAQVIDAKSPFTARHSERVAEIAVEIGLRRGYDASAIRDLRRAGLLHDIGKLGVSNAILDKPGRLDDDEMAAIRRHPLHTEEILLKVTAFSHLAVAAAAHHERLDGKGYHRGLSGDALPRDARLLAVADVFEALTAERPYRAPMPVGDALALMRRDVGTAFCADSFSALQAWLDDASALAA